MNAGTCGSDPFFNFKVLKELLINYQPDIVLQSFTTNDYYQDFVIRGGNERFLPNNQLKFKDSPWWTHIYGSNFIFRILIHLIGYNKLLITQNEQLSRHHEMTYKTIELFKEYQTFCTKNNIELILFSFPRMNDFENYKSNNALHNIFNGEFEKFGLKFYNLENCYIDYIQDFGTSFKDYYWKYDGHHNAKGYEMMAHCIEDILTPYLDKTNK